VVPHSARHRSVVNRDRRTGGGASKSLRFLREKKQEDFSPVGARRLTSARTEAQKCFASFLEKEEYSVAFQTSLTRSTLHHKTPLHPRRPIDVWFNKLAFSRICSAAGGVGMLGRETGHDRAHE